MYLYFLHLGFSLGVLVLFPGLDLCLLVLVPAQGEVMSRQGSWLIMLSEKVKEKVKGK
jgi:hypothetical protein